MTISTVRDINNNVNYAPAPVYAALQDGQLQSEKTKSAESIKDSGNTSEQDQNAKELTYDEAQKVTKEMNKFMKLLNADLRFVLHEKTNILMVQVVDSKDDTVLKEFPPHEFLDTKAKIREYIGILLDKHA